MQDVLAELKREDTTRRESALKTLGAKRRAIAMQDDGRGEARNGVGDLLMAAIELEGQQ